jgi:outer membrane protein assembly factor BamB
MMWLLLVGLGLASDGDRPYADPHAPPPYRSVVQERDTTQPAYEGDFSESPFPHWSRPLPGGRLNSAAHTELTRPVVVEEGILVGSAAGDALYLLDRRDGSTLRSYPAAASVESAPLVVGDFLFFSDTGGYSWCYRRDGTEVWRHQGNAPVLVRPTFSDGRLFVTNVDDLVVALDAQTGTLIWRFQQKPDLTRSAELALYAAPPAAIADDEVLVGFSTGDFVGLDAATGDLQWQMRVGQGRYPDIVAEAAVTDDLFFVNGYFEPLLAVERSNQQIRWSLPHGSAAAPLLADVDGQKRLYHPGTDGRLRAVEASTGVLIWQWMSDETGALTTPTLTPAGLVVSSSSGTVYLLDADKGTALWAYKPSRVMEGVTSSPEIAGRQLLFVSNAGILYSLLAPKAETVWPPPSVFEGRRKKKKKKAETPSE